MVFNDLFCLSHPEVHTLSLGVAKPQDFDEHLKTLELVDRASEILPLILVRLESEAIATLGEDWVKTWQTNLPALEKTPGEVNIRVILWLWNLAIAYDLVDYAKMRYNLLGNGSHWFPGNKGDRLDQLDLRQCLVHSPHADKIPHIMEQADKLLASAEVKRLSQS